MSKLSPYAPFAGVKDGVALLSLLSDKGKLEEVRKVLVCLQEERERINEMIEDKRRGDDLKIALSGAIRNENETKRILEEEMVQVKQRESDFEKWKDQEVVRLAKQEESIQVRERKLNDQIVNAEAQVAEYNKKMANTQENLNKQIDLFKKQKEEFMAEKKGYDAVINAVKSAGK